MDDDAKGHLQAIKEKLTRRQRQLELQRAQFGTSIPPHIVTEIEDVEAEIQTVDQKLKITSRSLSSDPIADKERIECPYPGMVPFRAEDMRFFYGREAEIRKMLHHLRHHRFLFVIGPSGSGKSSLVRAGLLPHLENSTLFPKDYWLVREMRPGDQPIQTLEQAIQGSTNLYEQAVATLLVSHSPAQRLLVVIDQFEELFTQAARADQHGFIAALHALRTLQCCALVIVMRADFYPDLMNSELWPVDTKLRLEIAPLRGEVLRQAIQQPAADVEVQLEPGLLELLLSDAADEPGVLPLIQETMVLLWDSIERKIISVQSYKKLGVGGRSGLAVAMATKADATLVDLTPQQQKIACRIFLRLAQFGEGRAHTRRQQPIRMLRSADDEMSVFESTVEHLTNNRLLTLSGAIDGDDRKVDISHEALIMGWPTFQGWLTELGASEQIRRRLKDKTDEWVERVKRGMSSGLLDAVGLVQAESWMAGRDADRVGIDEMLPALVEASRAAVNEGEKAQAASAMRAIESDRIKTDFIITVSHELRTPMTSIKGFTQLLAMGSLGPVNDSQKEFLQIIRVNAERMITIINDLLDITQIETGSVELDLRPLHLAESLSNVMMELQPNISARRHTLSISIPPGLPLVRADARRLNQILVNLLSNAVKYTPLGGKIALEAREVGIDAVPEILREGLKPSVRYALVEVRDTGVGVAPDEMERIFERFYRTENPLKVEAGGTGLGLSLVRPLVQLLGGQIWGESEVGEGSTFSFVLPAIQPEQGT